MNTIFRTIGAYLLFNVLKRDAQYVYNRSPKFLQFVLYVIFAIAAVGVFTLILGFLFMFITSNFLKEEGIITNVNDQYWFNAKIAFVVLLIYSAIGLVRGINESK
jgi:vacuolar-type H+-ATPase subunit I/STV1